MNMPLDPRVNAWRPDLASASLKGRVEAARFAEGRVHRVKAGRAPLTGEPDAGARHTSELLYGERFTVFDERDGWAWGQNATDGYVGWTPAHALDASAIREPTHRLKALRSLIFPEPDLKTPPLDAISIGSPLAVTGEGQGWLKLAGGGWVFAGHVEPAESPAHDPVATALSFLGTPYLWGGRSSLGIDCSGLVQIALSMANVRAPRDSDMQRDAIGTLVSGAEGGAGTGIEPRRGDVVGFPGHIGLMLDGERLVHATAFTLSVCIEPLADVARRAGGILAVRRL